jgi:hypothetical protein
MAVLKITTSVKGKEVLAALMVEPLPAKVMEGIEASLKRPNFKSLATLQSPFITRIHTEFSKFDRQMVATWLRRWVDEWMETGIVPGEGEKPNNRDLLKAPLATKALRDYVAQNQPRLMFFPKLPEFVVEVGRHEPETDPQSYRGSLGPEARAHEEASRLFLGLMMTESAQLLCKCRHANCGCYFLMAKFPRKCYKSGTYCSPKHQRNAKAAACTVEKRQRVEAELIQHAAKRLRTLRGNPQWHQDRKRKERLAEDVRKYLLSSRNPELQKYSEIVNVKVGWITRHRQKIEQSRLELLAPK